MIVVTLLIVTATIVALVRRVEVRLVLLGAGALMALVAGQPLATFDTFTRAMVAAMVAPICAAMGFAAVMSATGCDRHLVHLLLAPVRRVRGPGAHHPPSGRRCWPRASRGPCRPCPVGRTMSPVAAVVVYSAGLVGVSPVLLIRRYLLTLFVGGGGGDLVLT
ncbi:MAG: hypothetical protein ACREL9_11885 [Gemmatimonadales bacterium]